MDTLGGEAGSRRRQAMARRLLELHTVALPREP
jgi:hypothetical protein